MDEIFHWSSQWPSQIEVKGAGMPECNGIYKICEPYCNTTQWKHVENEMWIFWGGDFEGGWINGHSHHSGNGYRYCFHSNSHISSEFDRGSDEYYQQALTCPGPPPSNGWGAYVTGYSPPNFVGGVAPAPTLNFWNDN